MTSNHSQHFILWWLLLATIVLFSNSVVANNSSEATLEDDTILLNFEKADLRTVIEVISKETQKNFLLDPRVRKQSITLIAEKPVNRSDAYDVFLSILRIYGYGAIESGDIVKIVPLSEARQNEVQLFAQDQALKGDNLATIIIPLEDSKAEQMAGIIRPMIPSFGQVIAHGDSNSLIILAPLGIIKKVQDIINELEAKIKRTIKIVPLRYSQAGDIIEILTKLEKKAIAKTNGLLLVADKRSNQVIISGGTAKDKKRVVENIAQLDIAKKNLGNTQVIYLNYAKAKDLAALLKAIVTDSAKGAKGAPINIKITADENTNSLVIYAPSGPMQEIKNTITKLDIRKAQVLVQAIIVEISDNNAAQLGVRWGVNTNSAVGLIDFTGAGSLINLLAGNAGSSNPAALGAGSSLALGSFGNSKGWGLLLKALRSDSGVNILSTPSVVTLDNEEASIVVGQEIPFITGQSTQNSGNPFTTIQRKEVGLKLAVTPRINQGDAIQLKIDQEVSSLQSSARVATGASDIITAKRTINTTVIIDNNEILVLGGLTTQQTEQSAETIPGLSDVPFIGGLFKSEQNQSEKRTLMVFIKTNIIKSKQENRDIVHEKYTALYKTAANRKALALINKNNQLKLPTVNEFLNNPKKAEPSNINPTPSQTTPPLTPLGKIKPQSLKTPKPVTTIKTNKVLKNTVKKTQFKLTDLIGLVSKNEKEELPAESFQNQQDDLFSDDI